MHAPPLALAILLLVVAGCDAVGGGDPDLAGVYTTTIAGNAYVLTLQQSGGDLVGTMEGETDFVVTGRYDYPDVDLTFTVGTASDEFAGTVNEAGTRIAGHLDDADETAVVFVRAGTAPPGT